MVAPLRQFRPFIKEPEEKVGAIQGKRAGSLPEWRVAVALWKFRIPFRYQVAYFGGRRLRGGQIVDYDIQTRPNSTLLFIDGDYWHGSPSQREQDRLERALLRTVLGKQILEWKGSQLDSQTMADNMVANAFRGRF